MRNLRSGFSATHPGRSSERAAALMQLRHWLIFLLAALLCLALILVFPNHATVSAGTAQKPSEKTNASAGIALMTVGSSTRGVALESINLRSEPFAPTQPINFGTDNHTRVILFATNLGLGPGEGTSFVTVDAQDALGTHYNLPVEYVGPVPGDAWLWEVMVRLNDSLGDVGDVLVGVTVHGLTSNRVRIGIGHLGGGPPDDAPPPPPDLGSGASLHGKQLFPPDNPWNQDISNDPVDPNSDNLIAGIGNSIGLHPDFGTVYNGAP